MRTSRGQLTAAVLVGAAMLAAVAVNRPGMTVAAVSGPADWRADVVALAGVDLRGDDSDVDEALGDVVGDAKVVLLGDATHGTHELYQVKSRLVRYLVNEHGFDTVLLEDAVDGVDKATRYVDGKAGNVRDVLAPLQQLWNSAEVADLVDVLRTHNAGGGEPVRFLGADAPAPEPAIGYIADYLQSTKPRATAVARQLACMPTDFDEFLAYAKRPAAERARCRANVRQVRTLFRQEAKRAPRSVTFDLAHAAAVGLPTWEAGLAKVDTDETDPDKQAAELEKQLGEAREQALADQVTAALERNPDSRIVVWAHDMHAGRFRNLDMPDPFGGSVHIKASLGALLTDRLGRDAVKIIGSTVGTGTFHGADVSGEAATGAVTAFPLPGKDPQGSDMLLDTVDDDVFVLPLDTAGDLTASRPARIAVSWAWDPGAPEAGGVTVSLPDAFDAVLHVRHSTPTRLYPAPAPDAGS